MPKRLRKRDTDTSQLALRIVKDSPTATESSGTVRSPRSPAGQADRTSKYEPLSSIWEGSDGDLLEEIFRFYATIKPEPILDATYNAGRFW
jgi:hypothetical protein